jgi:hypothetical protein
VIVFCSEGYTSSLAAASLQDLGLWRARVMLGGFQAWKAMNLSIIPRQATGKNARANDAVRGSLSSAVTAASNSGERQ